jgi:hypothetical protein
MTTTPVRHRIFHTYQWPLEPNQTAVLPYRKGENHDFRATTRILNAARKTYLYRGLGFAPHARHTPDGIEFYWEITKRSG